MVLIVEDHPPEHCISASNKLPKLLSLAFACILEESIQELAIMGKIVDVLEVKIDLKYAALNERYGTENNNMMFESTGTSNELKFQKDRSFLEEILKQTMTCLMKTHSFDALEKILNDQRKMSQEEISLLEDVSNKEKELKIMKSNFERDKKTYQKNIQELSEAIGSLKDEYEDTLVENEIKMNYIQSWESSRNEQNNTILDMKEENHSNTTKHYNIEISREMRVHEEIANFIAEIQQDYENDIETWMERYDNEIEQRDNDIITLKAKIENQNEEYVKLSETYENHQKEIDDYLAYKEQKRLEAEELMKRIKAAIRIQAWWRGTMVRRKLGPYRVKKKGKKGNDKKGKGKGEKKKK